MHETSSCIGDPRERCEVLDADHRTICQFDDEDDPNYQRVSADIQMISTPLSLDQTGTASTTDVRRLPEEDMSLDTEGPVPEPDTANQMPRVYPMAISHFIPTSFEDLEFPGMFNRMKAVDTPAANTCQWVVQDPEFLAWLRRVGPGGGMIEVVGKPGSGKSTLMKSIAKRIRSDLSESEAIIASFFFDGRESPLEHSTTGLFRYLLHQVLRAVAKLCRQDNSLFPLLGLTVPDNGE